MTRIRTLPGGIDRFTYAWSRISVISLECGVAMERGGQPHTGLDADIVLCELLDDVIAGPRRVGDDADLPVALWAVGPGVAEEGERPHRAGVRTADAVDGHVVDAVLEECIIATLP